MPEHEHLRHTELSDQEVTADLLAHTYGTGPTYWLAVVILAVLFVAGIVGFIVRLSAGLPNTPAWGYYAATFSFLLSTVMAAPIIPTALQFTKGLWTRPINRAAMLFVVPGILWGLMYIPLLGALPPMNGRATIWFSAPESVMRWVDSIAFFSLVVLGLVLLYFQGRPDWAAVRDSGRGGPLGLARLFSQGWIGSMKQWTVLQKGFGLLGAFYLLLYAYVTMFATTDFHMSLVPGWRSANFPEYHIVTSAQAALATMLVTSALLRGFGGLGRYIGLDQFWSLGKLQLAFTLLWFYFFWSEFLVIWYGRTPREITLLQIMAFGPYFTAFMFTVLFAFAIPFALLIWNPIRKSIPGPTIAAASTLIGLFFDRIRLYVPAYTVAGVGGASAGQVPPTRLPDLADILMMVGALAGVVLIYLFAIRLLPVVSIWQMKVALMLRETRTFLRTHADVVGKPD